MIETLGEEVGMLTRISGKEVIQSGAAQITCPAELCALSFPKSDGANRYVAWSCRRDHLSTNGCETLKPDIFCRLSHSQRALSSCSTSINSNRPVLLLFRRARGLFPATQDFESRHPKRCGSAREGRQAGKIFRNFSKKMFPGRDGL